MDPTADPTADPTVFPTLRPTELQQTLEIIDSDSQDQEMEESENENGQIDGVRTTTFPDADVDGEAPASDAELLLSDKYLLSNWYYLLGVGLLLVCAMCTLCICCARMSSANKDETDDEPKAGEPQPAHMRVMSMSGFSETQHFETDGDGGVHEVTVQMMTPQTPGLLSQNSQFAAVTPVTPLGLGIDMGQAGEVELPTEAEDADDDMYDDTDEDALDVLYDEQQRRTAGNTPENAHVDDNAAMMTPQHPQ